MDERSSACAASEGLPNSHHSGDTRNAVVHSNYGAADAAASSPPPPPLSPAQSPPALSTNEMKLYRSQGTEDPEHEFDKYPVGNNLPGSLDQPLHQRSWFDKFKDMLFWSSPTASLLPVIDNTVREGEPLLSDTTVRHAPRRIILYRFLAACICMALTIAPWVVLAFIIQDDIQDNNENPYFVTWFVRSMLSWMTIVWAIWYFIRGKKMLRLKHQFTWKRYLLSAFLMSFIMFFSALMWYASLSGISVSGSTAVSACTPVFVYIFAVPILKERIVATKLLATVLCVAGALIVALTAVSTNGSGSSGEYVQDTPLGYIEVFINTILWSLFLVLYQRFGVDHIFETEPTIERMIFYPFLFVGVCGLIMFGLMWVGIPILYLIKGSDTFAWPSWNTVRDLIGSAILSVFGEITTLVGIACSSALFISIGSILALPISSISEVYAYHYHFPAWSYIGIVLVVVGTGILYLDQIKVIWLFYKNRAYQPVCN
ncbi:hypothetical protein Pelo_1814 [Pelomyxa schiedti]|nr:hypothetical protein Pelo_1814 [Pelomyxa schiedti]